MYKVIGQLTKPQKVNLGPSIDVYNRTLRVKFVNIAEMMEHHNANTNWGTSLPRFWRDSRSRFTISRDAALGDTPDHESDSDFGSLSDHEFPIVGLESDSN